MTTSTKRKVPDIVYRRGKPAAVILDIDEYESILDRLEDYDDLEELREMRKKTMKFYDLEDVLNEINNNV